MGFTHLHVHSNYSLLQGAFSVQELVGQAAARGMPAVALTDTNGLYGAMFFYHAAREAGIRPIIGAEIVHGAEQCVCLAADRRGYANLCRIVSERKLVGTPHYAEFMAGTGRAREPFDVAAALAGHGEGLFVLTATPSLLRRLKGVVPEGRLYVELRADGPHSFETRCPALRAESGPTARSNEIAADVAERLGIPPAATVNVNFLRPEGRRVHAVLSAIRENITLKDLLKRERLAAQERSFFMPPQQVAARLPAELRDEAMRNTARIAEACRLEPDTESLHFPRADLPEGIDACRRLRQVAFDGARQRYGDLANEARARLERELDVIGKLDFCHYFLVVRDIVAFAEREGIPHVGRGSAANSIVSYCLGISAVDPLKFGLPFERFLNEFRTDVPDIDIDFCWRGRDEVINYVYEKHGKERVAMVSTHCTLRARSAFRDVARVMGLPLDEIDAYSKRLPHYGAEAIEEAMETFPEMAGFPIDTEPWRSVVRIARRIDGYVRHVGIHLGGLVISDRPLTHYTPVENSTKGIVVTQYEMDEIELTGLVKMDLLGQRSLSIVAEAAENVRERHGVEIDLENLPDPDPKTATLLRHGRTMGCFQIESPGMRQLLQMLRAETIMDLIQALSLIRPGPSGSGMKHTFIRRRRGEEPVSYPTPLLQKALGATWGVMLYQEDILCVAKEVAGFSLAEGDELRKHISKDRSLEKLQRLRERFVRGAVERGVARTVAEGIWKRIEDFAAYSYCKAHATTYGHISYQASYLKAHWPAEFLAAVLANKAGFYDPRTYLNDARRFNVPVLPPCVNRSDVECRPEAGAIRPGLESVRALSRRTIRRTLQERLRRPYESLEDYHGRVRPGREELENLVLCGALDCLGHSRPTLMMKVERVLSRSNARPGSRRRKPAREAALLPAAPEAGPPEPVEVPQQPPFPRAGRVLWELKILGFSHSGHPLDAWNGRFHQTGGVPSFELARRVGERVAFVGWLITTRRAVTRNGEFMKFVTLEDRHGVVEAVLFPDAYRAHGARLDGAGCYRVEGRVDEQHGAVTIAADSIEPLPRQG